MAAPAEDSWREYLNGVNPTLEILQKSGCTRSEALIILELNSIQNVLRSIDEGMRTIVGVCQNLAKEDRPPWEQ